MTVRQNVRHRSERTVGVGSLFVRCFFSLFGTKHVLSVVHTLYRARLSRMGLCLIMLPVVETLAFILLAAAVVVVAVTAGAVDVVVDVAVDVLFTTPRFFNEPIEPFNRSGLSTSGPPNSCSCCSQQHSIASMPSST